MNPRTLHRPRHLTEQDIRAGNRPGDSLKVDKYLETDSRYNADVLGTPGDVRVSANWGGVNISVFSPSACSRANLNNHSLVVVFEYLGFKVVIPGDNEEESWEELLLDEGFPPR
jgi:beta-lactamase superfamily II metal-dependent hydrolase